MTHARILVSAYACEPGKGSEPGVGWNWALTLAERHDQVWVMTRSNNRASIEEALTAMADQGPDNLRFVYYDLPAWARWWKKGQHGVHLYYLLWQWGAYRLARRWHAEIGFDLVHHVTFVSARQPSFMGKLGIPFIFGPVAGGERAPFRLRKGYRLRSWFRDTLRDVVNGLVRFDPLMHHTFACADRILATSEETRRLIPTRYRHKTAVRLGIAMETDGETGIGQARTAKTSGHGPRILFVGQFNSWKGMHLGLRAFARLLDAHPAARLTLVGGGPEEATWKLLARTMNIADQVAWRPWVPRSELSRVYRTHDVLLFPSLRDSGGMVVLEAMAQGLPVVCLKLGGPGVLVDDSCGRAIDVKGLDEGQVVERLGGALTELSDSPELYARTSRGATERALRTTWGSLARAIYAP